MPPRVAGIFGGGASRAKKPSDIGGGRDEPAQPGPEADFGGLVAGMLESDKDQEKKAKYVYAAAEKASERRSLMETLKAKRLEREISRLEATQGPVLKFNTAAPTQHPVEKEEGIEIFRAEMNQEVKAAADVDFEGMRKRYFERAEKKDILKLAASPEQIYMIVHWAELQQE